MENYKFKEVSQIVNDFGGRNYTESQKELFKNAKDLFKDICNHYAPIGYKCELSKINKNIYGPGILQNYLWCQMKREDVADKPYSLSFFCDKTSANRIRWRVALELKSTETIDEEFKNYHRYIEYKSLSQIENLSFAIVEGTNKEQTGVVNIIEELEKLKSKQRIQPRIILEKEISSLEDNGDDFGKEIQEAITSMDSLYRYLIDILSNIEEKKITTKGTNRIFYGIPGSGKSYKIKKELEEKGIDSRFIFRTTFYLDYSNSDFVGQILPYVEDGKAEYKYVPGPFTKALRKALENKNKEVYLVIEELNRGNAAAIFGDIFQLLDRKNGLSEYPISNHFIEEYFKQEDISDLITEGQIIIPSNMFIYATMNTSDQNVFPLDTAFKRRWKLERVVPEWTDCTYADEKIPATSLTWKEFANTINTKMCEESKDGLILEDKQLGPWFVDEEVFTTDDKEEAITAFTDKVIDYIWSDVAKFDRKSWFDPSITDFNKIREEVTKYVNETYDDKKKDFKITSISSYLKSENE